jgi:hypothetical protein
LTCGTGRSLLAITERGKGSSGNGAHECLLSGAVANRQLLACFVEKLADASFGDVFGGPRTITGWAIVDPGPI